jgi:hypothetical protein
MNKLILSLTFALFTLSVIAHGRIASTSPFAGANLTTVQIYNKYREEYQNITYYVNDYGEAVSDDIIWGPEELLLSWRVSGEERFRQKRWDAVTPAHGWPSFPIPYRYETETVKSTLKADVEAALNAWRLSAPYLSFVERPPSSTPEVVCGSILCLLYRR